MPDVLRQHEDRIRCAQVQELGPAGPYLAQANLAFARSQNPATAFVERREQRGAAVVVELQRGGGSGTAGEADRPGGDVLLQVGDGLAVADQDGLPEPAVGAGFDTDAGGDELGGGLPLPLDAFDLDVLPWAAEDFLEGADPLDADAGRVSETNRPTPRRARMRPSSSSSMSASRTTVRLTFMSVPSSVSVGSIEPGVSRLLRMASAIREYTATRSGEPGWACTGWDRNLAASSSTLCLACVWSGKSSVPRGVTRLLDKVSGSM